VLLERAQDLHQLVVGPGHRVLHLVQVARVPHPRHHVLALGVREEVAGRRRLAGDLVARERHPAAGVLAAVPEHHLLHVDGGAPLVRDLVDAAVLDGALAGPGVEHGADRLLELLLRVLRELLAGLVPEDPLEVVGQCLQVVHAELHVVLHARRALALLDQVLVALAGDAAADVPEHLHEAAVGVPREAVAAQALDGVFVEAEVEHGVEHPGHRLAGAAADGHEQRVLRVAQRLPGLLLEPLERGGDLVLRELAPVHVRDAGLCGDREARRHPLRPEHARHLGDVRALPAEQLAHVLRPLGEVVDQLRVGRGRHAGILFPGSREYAVS
jgi:hypothetical protein